MCVADIAVADGEKTVEQFKKEYGPDAAFFTKCDVTSKPDMESKITTVLSYITYTTDSRVSILENFYYIF